MTPIPNRAGRLPQVLATALLVASVAACGAQSDYANQPRPPAPINVTALIDDERVRVSPRSFGAGPINLIIANESSSSQGVTLETNEVAGSRPGLQQRTSPVNPRGTAELKVEVTEGSYRLSVGSERIRPASITVGEPRRSAQDDLLQP